MDANAEDDASILWQAGVALDHGVLHFDGAAHGVDHAAKFGEEPVTGAFNDARFVYRDGRVDQVAAQRPQSGQCSILVGRGQTTESNDVSRQDRRDLSIFGHPPRFRTSELSINDGEPRWGSS